MIVYQNLVNKGLKYKIFSITLFLITLSLVCMSSTSVNAVQSTDMQESLAILSRMASLNTTAYNTTTILAANQSTTYKGLSQQITDFELTDNKNNLRVTCSFVQGHLHQIFVSDNKCPPMVTKSFTNAIDMAQNFLLEYKSYTGSSLYEDLGSMLEEVTPGENTTKSIDNLTLKISTTQTKTDLLWTYVDSNGIPAPLKNIELSYENGFLKCFIDNWQLYTVTSSPKLTNSQAIDVALKAAQNYSWIVNDDNSTKSISGGKIVSIGNTSVCYLNNQDAEYARGGNPFVLYPSWFIPLGFDKIYPGSVSGLYIRVWADTGQIVGISPMDIGVPSLVTPSPSTADSANAQMPFVQMALIAGTFAVVVCVCKSRIRPLKGISKAQLIRYSAISICALLTACSLLTTTPIVKGFVWIQTPAATIYGSNAGQVSTEIAAGQEIANTFATLFSFRENSFCLHIVL